MYRIGYKRILRITLWILLTMIILLFLSSQMQHIKSRSNKLRRIKEFRIPTLISRRSTQAQEDTTAKTTAKTMKEILMHEAMFKSEVKACDKLFTNLGNKAARLINATVSLDKLQGDKRGGEQIESVLNQKEANEYFKLQNGFFTLKSRECAKPVNNFSPNDHLRAWFASLSFETSSDNENSDLVEKPTVAVMRYEYANIYHTMTDWYNAFLLMKYFDLDSNTTDALWIDAHPEGALDKTWSVLFRGSRRVTQLSSHTKFRQLYWNPLGYFSPLLQHSRSSIPFIEEFRSWFLTRFAVTARTELDCKSPKVTFLFRRDYVAHPRNPKGTVRRKIANEADIVKAVKNRFLTFRVQNISTEKLDMKEQLKIFSSTDILIGMHGAGLTHAMFLPKHAGLLEMYPAYFSASNRHFYSIAKWRNLRYEQWINSDQKRELSNFRTIIPLDVVVTRVKSIYCKMCSQSCGS